MSVHGDHRSDLRGIPSHTYVVRCKWEELYRTYFTSAAEVPFGLPGRRETANVKRNSEGAEGDGGNG